MLMSWGSMNLLESASARSIVPPISAHHWTASRGLRIVLQCLLVWLLLGSVSTFRFPSIHCRQAKKLVRRQTQRSMPNNSDWNEPQWTAADDMRVSQQDEHQHAQRLVVLIPAYNEAERIAGTLLTYCEYLASHNTSAAPPWGMATSIVVVDDGSKDGTCDVVHDFCSLQSAIPIECISLPTNQGKGAAISFGIQHISNSLQQQQQTQQSYSYNCDDTNDDPFLLIVDADGSADLRYFPEFAKAMELHSGSDAMIIGNRAYQLLSRRGITRWGFQTAVQLILLGTALPVSDTQCGYKFLRVSVAQRLYDDLYLRRWSHDVEVLYRTALYGIPCRTVDIEWEDKAGSKVEEAGVVQVSLQMLWDIIRLRWVYFLLALQPSKQR